MVDDPTVPIGAKNVVFNLRSSLGKVLEHLEDWQVDAAHRNWSTSDDFPDENKIVDWAPSNSDKAKEAYIRLTEHERK